LSLAIFLDKIFYPNKRNDLKKIVKVAVYSNRGSWMSYTNPAKARKLLKNEKAVIHRHLPFSIKLIKEFK
jgi:hypothetical protein